MNSKSGKTSNPPVLTLSLTDEINLWKGEKSVALSNVSIFYTWIKIKKSYNNNKFKIAAPKWIIFYIRYSRLFWIYL